MKNTLMVVVPGCDISPISLSETTSRLSPLMESLETALMAKNALNNRDIVWEVTIIGYILANCRILLCDTSSKRRVEGISRAGIVTSQGTELVGHPVIFGIEDSNVRFLGGDTININLEMGEGTCIFYIISALFAPISVNF